MEEKTIAKQHKMTLNNRKTGNFTGILDVLSFDLSEILLETELGMLHIKGRDLHVNRLDLGKGEVDIDGQVDALRRNHLSGLALRNIDGQNVTTLTKDRAREIRRILDGAGLSVYSIA